MSVAAIPLQRDLFDTREWRPPKVHKPSPEDLLGLIRSMSAAGRQCFASMGWFAKKFCVGVRTIGRWLVELRTRVRVFQRPGRTSIFTALSKPVDKVADLPVRPTAAVPYINPTGILKMKAGRFRMPVEFITHPEGRTERNPEHIAIQEVLRRSIDRIQRAENPLAYEQAILRREFPHLWEPAGTQPIQRTQAHSGALEGGRASKRAVFAPKRATERAMRQPGHCTDASGPDVMPVRKSPAACDFQHDIEQLSTLKRFG